MIKHALGKYDYIFMNLPKKAVNIPICLQTHLRKLLTIRYVYESTWESFS